MHEQYVSRKSLKVPCNYMLVMCRWTLVSFLDIIQHFDLSKCVEHTQGLHVPLPKYCVAIAAAFSSSHLWSSLASFSQEASGSVLTQYSPSAQLFSLSVEDCCSILSNWDCGISRPKNPPTFFQSLTSPITSVTFSTVRVESKGEAWGKEEDSENHSIVWNSFRPSVTSVYF